MKLTRLYFIFTGIIILFLYGCATKYTIQLLDEENQLQVSGIQIEILDENGVLCTQSGAKCWRSLGNLLTNWLKLSRATLLSTRVVRSNLSLKNLSVNQSHEAAVRNIEDNEPNAKPNSARRRFLGLSV